MKKKGWGEDWFQEKGYCLATNPKENTFSYRVYKTPLSCFGIKPKDK
jgi:hypothetical protein